MVGTVTGTFLSTIIKQCNKNNIIIIVLLFSASVNCQNPVKLVDESVHAVGFKEPGTVGAYVTLVCDSGWVLTGPNMSTCMGNGGWEPDPREAECIITSTTTHMTTPSVFEALGLDGKIAVASSVTVFVVASGVIEFHGLVAAGAWRYGLAVWPYGLT